MKDKFFAKRISFRRKIMISGIDSGNGLRGYFSLSNF
jgi:hypothetical protein